MASAPTTDAAPDAAGLVIRQVPITHPDAQFLIEAVQGEYVARYGGRDESLLLVDPAEFVPPRGAFFVGYLPGDADLSILEPVASGAWHARPDLHALGGADAAELKRMYVRPSAQRRGFARQMLRHVQESVAAAGHDVLILETGTAQPEAMALYESSGYVPVPGFGQYRDNPTNRAYALRLVG